MYVSRQAIEVQWCTSGCKPPFLTFEITKLDSYFPFLKDSLANKDEFELQSLKGKEGRLAPAYFNAILLIDA